MKRSNVLLAGLPALLFCTAIAAAPADHAHAGHAGHEAAKPATAPAAAPARADRSPVRKLPLVVVHKSPTCGCCGKWVDHLRHAGFVVEVRDETNMAAVKERVGIPPAKGSCHTAEVAGYFVEGHVPAEDIRKLIAEKPDARGITLPNMPTGSPGMESPSGFVEPYTVLLVKKDGTTVDYVQHAGNFGTPGAESHEHHHHHEH